MIPRLSFNHFCTPSMQPYGESMVTGERSRNPSISGVKICNTSLLVHAEIIPVTCYTKSPSRNLSPCSLKWKTFSKIISREVRTRRLQQKFHVHQTFTHLLMNRPVIRWCSAVQWAIYFTETYSFRFHVDTAGAGIQKHAFVFNNLIIFPVLCSIPATAGDLISKESTVVIQFTLVTPCMRKQAGSRGRQTQSKNFSASGSKVPFRLALSTLTHQQPATTRWRGHAPSELQLACTRLAAVWDWLEVEMRKVFHPKRRLHSYTLTW